ncbi:hypothetical protein F511_29854 [Dorcoceras hygrometricum]|uniref:Uncharacterized protein n=1 Tax=Dorcoceras hygrometricum TaxID=472368 RepID=A0A2Z7BC95_9LAMI|nr:hypothetical protein F511_29854 [Dorcoceras hygrometricum]
MASAYISNALQINFDSVLGQDNEGMLNMFKALEASRLRGFLGCPSVLYEQELEQFFDTAIVQDGDITCAVSGKYVAISESRFAGVFNLPTHGLTDLSEVPNHLVMQARTVFAKFGKPVLYSCKKRLLKYEFRLLNDILAKSITVKAGSFDAVTHERFFMMTAIHFGVNIDARGESDEPEVANVAIVKKKAVSKKRPAAVSEGAAVKKKRTTSGKAVSKEKDVALISVAQDVEPISVVPSERPHKRTSPKRKLRIIAGSDDEIVEKEPAATTVVVEQKEQIDDVDTIIEEPDEGVSDLVVDRIGVNYRNLPRRAGFLKHRLEPGTSASERRAWHDDLAALALDGRLVARKFVALADGCEARRVRRCAPIGAARGRVSRAKFRGGAAVAGRRSGESPAMS